MGSADFLKKLTKEDKIIYSYAALTNLLCALSLAEEHDDYFEIVPEFTCELAMYLKKLSVILRDLGIRYQKKKYMTDYDPDYHDYLDSIGINLHNHYEMDLNSCYTNRIDLCEKIDIALI